MQTTFSSCAEKWLQTLQLNAVRRCKPYSAAVLKMVANTTTKCSTQMQTIFSSYPEIGCKLQSYMQQIQVV
jgi:hypothetical protein